jgi:hypothetical protein
VSYRYEVNTSLWMSALVTLGACAGGSGGKAIAHEYDNTGRVCLCATDDFFCEHEPQAFAANRSVAVKFSVAGCLSSSCSRDIEASCELTRDGASFAVTTTASYTDLTAQNRACTDDCGMLGATCETGPLPAGDYTFSYGTKTLALTIPSEVNAPCADN